ncbi:protein-tyrosine phosphatase-like protein, partial [Paraphysoderma sedebokerense]
MSHSRPPAGMVSSIIIPTPTSPFRFLILDCPSNETLPNYIPRFQEYNVKHIFRIADDSYHYETKQLEEMGITVHDELKFEDGTVPTAEQVKHWIDFLKNLGETTKAQNESVCPTVAVHCVSGVGRAPVLVALACIEHNIDTLDAIEIIRKHRRGALNKAQVKFLANFK